MYVREASFCDILARMEFYSKAAFNSLEWITSLKDSERGITSRILEDVEPLFTRRGLPFRLHEPQTAADLLSTLKAIASRASMGMKPIIHLDLHGSKNTGISVEASGEAIDWPTLANGFRTINAATKCSLTVVSGACFSFHAVSAVDITMIAPFYLMIAPEEEITGGELEGNLAHFYRDLFEGRDIYTTMGARFGNRIRAFHCEKMLAYVFYDFINEAGVGRQKKRRIEDYVSRAVADGTGSDSETLRRLRDLAGELVKPSEELLVRHGTVFLGGRSPSFTIADLKDEVLKGRREGVKPNGRYA